MMGSIKETNESGCRSMPGPGICMIVLEFISSVNRETLSYYIYCVRKVENSSSSSFHALFHFCWHETQTPFGRAQYCYLGTFESLKGVCFLLNFLLGWRIVSCSSMILINFLKAILCFAFVWKEVRFQHCSCWLRSSELQAVLPCNSGIPDRQTTQPWF